MNAVGKAGPVAQLRSHAIETRAQRTIQLFRALKRRLPTAWTLRLQHWLRGLEADERLRFYALLQGEAGDDYPSIAEHFDRIVRRGGRTVGVYLPDSAVLCLDGVVDEAGSNRSAYLRRATVMALAEARPLEVTPAMALPHRFHGQSRFQRALQ